MEESSSWFHCSFNLTVAEQLWEGAEACVSLGNAHYDCWLQNKILRQIAHSVENLVVKADDVKLWSITALQPIQQLTSNQCSLSLSPSLWGVFDLQLHNWSLPSHLTASCNDLEIFWLTNIVFRHKRSVPLLLEQGNIKSFGFFQFHNHKKASTYKL